MVKLDTRAARNDLTSRECVKLFGTLVSILVMAGHSYEDIRKAFGAIVDILKNGISNSNSDAMREGLDIDMVMYRQVSGMMGGLSDMAPAESIIDAVKWMSENDKFWKMISDPVARGAN